MQELPLRKCNGSIRAIALVDDDTFDFVNQWRWRVKSVTQQGRIIYYAVRQPKGQSIVSLHRVILGVTDRKILVDHINGDGLDNQRSNLRPVNHSQNAQNRQYGYGKSAYRGVVWNKLENKWMATTHIDGKRHHAGYFDDELSAAEAARKLRLKLMTHSDMDLLDVP